MGTAEIESALVLHEHVAKAAVVGYPHDIKGQGIYAYVTLNVGIEPSEELRLELIELVRKEIGPIAHPDIIQWAPGLTQNPIRPWLRILLRTGLINNQADQVRSDSGSMDGFELIIHDLCCKPYYTADNRLS